MCCRKVPSHGQIKTIRQHPLLLGLFFVVGVLVGAAIMSWRPTDPSSRMGYRELSNKDLADKGVAMGRALRALAREMMAADERLRSRCDSETELAKTEQAKNQLRQKTVPPILASHPTNALGLGEVASTLEVLAKLLPKMPTKA